MNNVVDFAVYSPDNRVQLLVEVKTKKAATDAWAAELRRNLLAHAMIPPSEFFLLAMPEYFYLWGPSASSEAVPADYKVFSKRVLERFLGDARLDNLSPEGLELLVNSWLSQIINAPVTQESSPELWWLFDSGLFEKIKGGSIHAEVAA